MKSIAPMGDGRTVIGYVRIVSETGLRTASRAYVRFTHGPRRRAAR